MRRALVLSVLVWIAAACGSGSGSGSDNITARVEPTPISHFATGDAVQVPAGYEPPTDRIDSTGAFLPVNGLPTLVYLEAIW